MEEDKIGEDNEIFKVSKTSFMNEGGGYVSDFEQSKF